MRRMLMNGMEENDVKEWKLIWESGKTNEEISETEEIDVSGYEELFVVCRIVTSENNPANRNGVLIVKDDEGKQNQMVIGALVASSGNAKMSTTFLQKIDNLLISRSATSANALDMFETGYVVENMSVYNASLAISSNIKSIIISNMNRHSSYVFGVGSTFYVYAR